MGFSKSRLGPERDNGIMYVVLQCKYVYYQVIHSPPDLDSGDLSTNIT